MNTVAMANAGKRKIVLLVSKTAAPVPRIAATANARQLKTARLVREIAEFVKENTAATVSAIN